MSANNSPFFKKLFQRISGLEAVLVTDAEGSFVIKTLSPSATIQQKNFDTTLPNVLQVAIEQGNKLSFEKCENVISFYENYIVIQTSTDTAEDVNIIKREDDEDDEGELYITLICSSNTSIQLVLDFIPQIKKVLQQL
ncbi:ragulator complex protein LAMTOR [Acrasis kona]|uniref:Ragulator complex protein LAMTOR n=1 Tax=Acrasis kona TaxID=1008807 RepID=A0AAW2YII2_9EUKA